jgi:hypothetical protein
MLFLTDPREAFDRASNRLDLLRSTGASALPPPPTDPLWERNLHSLLGSEWPCEFREQFEERWVELSNSLAGKSIQIGRGHDADIGLARVVWCLVRHMAPDSVVETGVARGVTSRFVLQGLEENGRGRLYSVDLPPLSDPWQKEVGIAVPEQLHHRWVYQRGSSKRLLPRICSQLNRVDLFVLDSLHTESNVHFELINAWQVLQPAGAIVVDDIDDNMAFQRFCQGRKELKWFVAPHEEKSGLFGVLIKEPLRDDYETHMQ